MADAFDDFRRELGDSTVELERIEDLAQGVSRSLSNAFRGAVIDGRSLNSVLSQVARSFADIALKAAFKPLGTLVGGAVESLFTSAKPFAKGGVIAAPTFFPHGRGMGVAGEAGPEAILPLARGSDGRPRRRRWRRGGERDVQRDGERCAEFRGERSRGQRHAAAGGAARGEGELVAPPPPPCGWSPSPVNGGGSSCGAISHDPHPQSGGGGPAKPVEGAQTTRNSSHAISRNSLSARYLAGVAGWA